MTPRQDDAKGEYMSDGNWMQESVRDFMKQLFQPAPTRLDLKAVRLELRAKLIMEEALETVNAMGFEVEITRSGERKPRVWLDRVSDADWPEVVDGLCDLLYVTFGVAVEAGFVISPFFAEVHRSNMLKKGGPVRGDGKVLKPEGWEPPRIRYLWDRIVARAKAGHRTA